MNRLSTLPRGFGSLPALEVLDLTYNNLNQSSLPGNFFYLSEWEHMHNLTSARTSPAERRTNLNNDVCFCSDSPCSLSQRQWLWNHPCWHWEAVKAANCKFMSTQQLDLNCFFAKLTFVLFYLVKSEGQRSDLAAKRDWRAGTSERASHPGQQTDCPAHWTGYTCSNTIILLFSSLSVAEMNICGLQILGI